MSKVLIVEDETASQIMAKRLVSSLGYDVLTADNGAIALSLIKEDPSITVIMTDCYMPELDGFGLSDAIRKDAQLEHIFVILLSADEKLKERARREEFFAWIAKPLRKENIAPVLSHPALQLVSKKTN